MEARRRRRKVCIVHVEGRRRRRNICSVYVEARLRQKPFDICQKCSYDLVGSLTILGASHSHDLVCSLGWGGRPEVPWALITFCVVQSHCVAFSTFEVPCALLTLWVTFCALVTLCGLRWTWSTLRIYDHVWSSVALCALLIPWRHLL